MPRKKKDTDSSTEIEPMATAVRAPKPALTKRAAASTTRKKSAVGTAKPRTRRPKVTLPDSPVAAALTPAYEGANGNGSQAIAAAPPPSANGVPDINDGVSAQEQIALLAYSYWESRGRQGGSPEEDWIRAEREILSGQESSASEA